MTKYLSATMLRKAGACKSQVNLFVQTFGKGRHVVTVDLAVAHVDKFNWDWASKNLLTKPAGTEYERARASARTEYDRARASARTEYERATASTWTEYERAMASARTEYARAMAPAWTEYERARAPAQTEYERATAAAWATAYINQEETSCI